MSPYPLPFNIGGTPNEPYRWTDLAIYNREVADGVVHTPERDAEMAEQQAAFDAEQLDKMRARYEVVHMMPGGGYLCYGDRLARRPWWRRLLRKLKSMSA